MLREMIDTARLVFSKPPVHEPVKIEDLKSEEFSLSSYRARQRNNDDQEIVSTNRQKMKR